ncbi:MAG: hypothetical protein AB7R40_22200 [Nitrospiraceae bacterium]
MAEVRVRYTGKNPIIVNDKTWFQDEVHTVNEKLAAALVAFKESIVLLTAPVEDVTDGADGADATDGADVVPVVAEGARKRKRK